MNKEFTAIIYDTETTGLIKPDASNIKQQPYITEIFCSKVLHRMDGTIERIGEFEHMLNVPIPLPAIITKITGLTDEDLIDKPAFREIYESLAKFTLGTHRIVAHNLAFDRSMLANELVRCDKIIQFPWPIEHVCTVEKTMHIEQRRMSLTNLHRHLFNEDFVDAHRARNDVDALERCYIELCGQGII